MITDKEIEEFGEKNALTPHEVEKDYVHSWVLSAIYSRPALLDNLILKGGNALRKGYLPDTRFSKDLDFSCQQHIDQSTLESELLEVCKIVESQTAVKFIDKAVVKNKNLPFDVDALEARIYFKGFYKEEKVDLKTQLDVTQFDKIYLPVQNRFLLHPYSDSDVCHGEIPCQKAEEILASKLTTLLHRRKAGDLFDLLYSIVVGGGYNVSRREVITTFLKKSIFEPNPEAARTELLQVPLAEYGETWNTILAPRSTMFGFEFVTGQFAGLINSLFDLIVAPVREAFPSGGFAGRPQRVGRTGGARPIGGGVNLFRGDFRNMIIRAGQSRRMIEMTYGGYRRLVEPYKLEYYVRRRDGVGNEYFWGYDTTGGSSGTTSIKQFFCDRIEAVSLTDRPYTPRYDIEL